MKKSILIIINLVAFILFQIALIIFLYSKGYATGMHPNNESTIYIGVFIIHLLLNAILLYFLKSLRFSFIIITYIEIIFLYTIVYLANYY